MTTFPQLSEHVPEALKQTVKANWNRLEQDILAEANALWQPCVDCLRNGERPPEYTLLAPLNHRASVSPQVAEEKSASFDKLLNLAMSEDKSYFITSGSGDDDDPIEDYAPIDEDRRFSRYSGVTLWNTDTGKPVAKLQGNSSKTCATISPDGQWVVSSDEAGIGLFWNTDRPDVRHRLARYHSGIYLEDTPFETGDPRNRDKSDLTRGRHSGDGASVFRRYQRVSV